MLDNRRVSASSSLSISQSGSATAVNSGSQRRRREEDQQQHHYQDEQRNSTTRLDRPKKLLALSSEEWRSKWDLRALISNPPFSSSSSSSSETEEMRLFGKFTEWRFIRTGLHGVVLSAVVKSDRTKQVAVKFQIVDPKEYYRGPRVLESIEDVKKTTDNVAESEQAVRKGLAHLPIVLLPAYMLEIRSWSLVQYALNPARSANRFTNVVQLKDWARFKLSRNQVRARFIDAASPEIRDDISKQFNIIFENYEKSEKEGHRSFGPADSVDIIAIVMELLPGKTVDALARPLSIVPSLSSTTENNMPFISELFSNSEYFLSIWTQLACTLAFLNKRISFRHGDMHMGNIILLDLRDQPQHPLYNKCLRYDLPIRDQHGKVTAWHFITPPTRFLVKIIDFGLSQTQVTDSEDMKNTQTSSETYSYDAPHFYLYRGDLSTAALVLMLYWGRQLRHYEFQASNGFRESLKPETQAAKSMRKLISSSMDMLAILLHAMGRQSLAPFAHTLPRRELSRALTVAYGRFDPPHLEASTWGTYVTQQAERLYKEQLECIKTRDRDRGTCSPGHREMAELLPGETSAGPWTVDEHLVIFARELGGFMAGSNYQLTTLPRQPWITTNRLDPKNLIPMLPEPENWPLSFYPEARSIFLAMKAKQQQQSLKAYPHFRGDAYGPVTYNDTQFQLPELNAYIYRYRTEQRSHDKLFVSL